MNQAFEQVIVQARAFLVQHFSEEEGQWRGKGNFTVQCYEVPIPNPGSLAYDYTEAQVPVSTNGVVPFHRIQEEKKQPHTSRRIFVIGIGEKVVHENGTQTGSYFLKIQVSNEKKECPLSVVIVGSKKPHTETEKFQALLGNTENLLLNFPLKEMGRILRCVAMVYGDTPVDRQRKENSVV